MTRSFGLALVGASSVLLTASACDETTSCTLIGCGPSNFTLVREDWPAGDYELEVSFTAGEEVAYLCDFRIAGNPNDLLENDLLEDDAGADAPGGQCRQTKGAQRSLVNVFVYDGVRLEMYDSPASLQLELRSAAETIFEDTITPQYITSYPNGSDCGPACQMTDTDIEL
jgi:hypothetical protein